LAIAGCRGSETDRAESDRTDQDTLVPREGQFVTRPFRPFTGDRWIGNAIAYGPHRDGQYSGGPSPNRDELREDLRLMCEHWSLLRLYDAAGAAETILDVIQEDALDMKVMLGVWIGVEERRGKTGEVLERFPEARAANRREVEAAIRLANAYPDIVLAINVGNETQVFWSSHRVPPELLIDYVREVRARTDLPVTVADDFNFWNKPESDTVAREVDFIVMHAHPLWNGILLEDALDWTGARFAEVQAVHPGHTIVLGESGWATQKHDAGEQAELIKGRPGEGQQDVFYDALSAWAERERITTFFFEAFDENWKGGEHPDEVEKHWGVFRADRTPKKALAR
jgi:exo-beta-1,3-glucanase (GH17 family)